MADNLNLAHQMLTVDDLADNVLLEIFNFYMVRFQDSGPRWLKVTSIQKKIESWKPLVQVCRRWRGLAFGSPRHLDMQVYYELPLLGGETVRVDVWPTLPFLISGHVFESSVSDAIAGLGHIDRISQISLNVECDSTIWEAMSVPFPELVSLHLSCSPIQVLPGSFLGGSAPRLRYFYLDAVAFPGLPKLLLSATHLVCLYLRNIPHQGYISPEAMAAPLPMLTNLEELHLEFDNCPQLESILESRDPFQPIATRPVLPALMKFRFQGVTEYLEVLVAQIDAPRLRLLSTMFFHNRSSNYKTSELTQFINRTPTLGPYDEAHLIIESEKSLVRLCPSHSQPSDHRMVEVKFKDDEELSLTTQICTSWLRPLLTIENLYISSGNEDLLPPFVHEDEDRYTENMDLSFFHPFTSVKNLYLSRISSPCIALTLQDIAGEGTRGVLPALQNIFIEGFQPWSIPHQRACDVPISAWDRLSLESFDL